ncbi:MAG: S1C family serine protease, partial [Vulcanimicrobiaceae bacterium]
QGIGFAIPSNTVKQIVDQLEKNPGTHQGTNAGFVGIGLAELTPNLRAQLNNYVGAGVVVVQVNPGTPAEKAGLNPGDVIQAIDGKKITTVKQAIAAIEGTKPGDSVALSVWENGVRKLATITVEERPAAIPNAPAAKPTP